MTYMEDNPEDELRLPSGRLRETTLASSTLAQTVQLTFKAQPNYEAPGDANGDNVYEVTVVAADDDGNRGTRAVKVTVSNVDEVGVVTLSRTQPRVGVEVTASLTDPDGSISGLRWQWYNGGPTDGDLTQNAIADATSDTYTPTRGRRDC